MSETSAPESGHRPRQAELGLLPKAINAIGQGPEYTKRRPCRHGALVPGWSEFDLELECAAAEAGETWILPLGAIAAARDGVLITTASGWGCNEWRAFDVANGRAAWLTQCSKKAPRWGLGRVHTDLLRETLFALFVAPHVSSGPTATTTTVPPTIRPLSTLGQFPEGVDGFAAVSSRQVQHSLTYFRKGAQVLSGKVKWPRDLTFPEQVYLVWLLDAVDASWRGDCSPTHEYDGVLSALARQFPALGDLLAPLRGRKRIACETTPLERLGAESP